MNTGQSTVQSGPVSRKASRANGACMIDVGEHRMLIDKSDSALAEELTLYIGSNGYVYFSAWVDGRSKPQLFHRRLMGNPRHLHVDHVNGNVLDNRRSNLRAVTPQKNQVNRKTLNRNNTSGIRGVGYFSGSRVNPWKAQITVDGRNIHLGLFPTKEEAAAARREAEIRYYGEACP